VEPSKKPAGFRGRDPIRSLASTAVIRTMLLALLAIGGATWALARHYAYRPPPLRVPRSEPTSKATDDDGTLQAPELLRAEDAAP
jgi:hypothetical protein